jgi:hypothetical protein
MTKDEQLARADMLRAAIEGDRPKPRLETRVEWLEADGSAQRTFILRLERELRWNRLALCGLAAYFTALALAVLT